MSEQGEIKQSVTEAEYAATSVTGDATITINNYYYREEARVVPADSADAADEALPCPYRGLFHFGPNDAEFFFGREIFIEELYSATKTRNFIPVLGASGSGKSSVVFAGLVPSLQKEGHWQFTHFRPSEGDDPFHALALALVPLFIPKLVGDDKLKETRKIAESLRNGVYPLSYVFTEIQHNYLHHRILLIADQFEELYTLCEEKIRRRFLDILLDGIHTPISQTPPLVLVTTMRADFLGNALSYPPFADLLRSADIKIRSMNREELTEVIEKPVAKLGVTFEAGLVKRILNDVQDQPGNLPLLEFALTQLWNQRTGKLLTHKIYEEIGQVEGALARHADEKYSNLTDDEKEKVRRIFIQLVRPGEGTEDTRRIAVKGELGELSWSLVKKLADARLVVTSRNATEQETVEVVHEALIRNWGELREWMDKDRVFRAWQERLRAAKRQWEATNKDQGSLLRGAALAEAEEKLKERPEELIAEKVFIEESIRYFTEDLLFRGTEGWENEFPDILGYIWEELDKESAFEQACERAITLNQLLKEIEESREMFEPFLKYLRQSLRKGIEPSEALEGGIGGVLATESQQVYDSLSAENKEIARQVFIGLVEIDSGGYKWRKTEIKNLISYRNNRQQVKNVIERFSANRIPLMKLLGTNEEVLVTHQALFTWPQLDTWLRESSADIPLMRRLEKTALTWEEKKYPEGSLWRSPDLDSLYNYYQCARDNFTKIQLEFLSKSVRAERHRIRNKLIVLIIFAGLVLTIISSSLFFFWQKKQEVNKLIEQTTKLVTNSLETDLELHLQSAWQVNQKFSALIQSNIFDLNDESKIKEYFRNLVSYAPDFKHNYLHERGFFWGSKDGKTVGIIFDTDPELNSIKKATVWISIENKEYKKKQQEAQEFKPECQPDLRLDSNNVVKIYEITKEPDEQKKDERMSEKSKSLPSGHLSSTKESGLQSLHQGSIDHPDASKNTSQTPSEEFIRYDPTKRPWYSEAEEKQQKWSSIYQFCRSKEFGMSAVIQINKNNELNGVLAVDVTLVEISEKLQEGININKDQYQIYSSDIKAFVVDEKDRLVAFSLPKSSSKQKDKNTTKEFDKKEGLTIKDNDLSSLYKEAKNRIDSQQNKNNNKKTLRIEFNGQDYFITKKFLDPGLKLDWYILVIIPENQDIDNRSISNFKVVIGFFLAFLLVGMMLFFWRYRVLDKYDEPIPPESGFNES